MKTENTGTGARILQRIEELLQSSTMAPETVLNILRSARANPGVNPLTEFERSQGEQPGTD